MKFQITPYHFDLLKDKERLAVFYEGIQEYVENKNSKNLVEFDIGSGSGILSYFSKSYFKSVIAIEKDFKAYNCAKENLKEFKNITLINEDVLNYDFNEKADLIVCEMLDTALIDEEEVPAINHARKFLKDKGEIIPKGIINMAELVNMEREYVHYEDVDSNIKYDTLSDNVIYSEFNFLDEINPYFETSIQFKIRKDSKINGIKITTFTKVTENIICGPTPMLNPPLLIPLNEKIVKTNDLIKVKLKYIMGQGIETIDVKII